MKQVRVYADLEAASEAASGLIREAIREAIAAGRDAVVALSGGGTPREAYRMLASGILQEAIPVDRILWLFGDERWVPRGHARSNEGMARETLLEPIRAPERSIASWKPGAGDPVDAARRYGEWTSRARARAAGHPDLILLGLGADGHTASLFPGAIAHIAGREPLPVAADLPRETAAVYLSGDGEWRLTLCPLFMNDARRVLFLVAGAEKATALRRVLDGDLTLPGSWIRGSETLFLATQDALGPGRKDMRGEARLA